MRATLFAFEQTPEKNYDDEIRLGSRTRRAIADRVQHGAGRVPYYLACVLGWARIEYSALELSRIGQDKNDARPLGA